MPRKITIHYRNEKSHKDAIEVIKYQAWLLDFKPIETMPWALFEDRDDSGRLIHWQETRTVFDSPKNYRQHAEMIEYIEHVFQSAGLMFRRELVLYENLKVVCFHIVEE